MSYIQLPSGNYFKLADGQSADDGYLQALKDNPEEFPQPDLSVGQELGHGLARGAENLYQDVRYGAPALYHGLTGDTEAAQQDLQQMQQAQQQTERDYRPQYKSFDDVHGVGNFLGYATENIAEQVPGLLAALIPGVGAEEVAGRLALRPVAEKVATDVAAQGLTGAEAQTAITQGVNDAVTASPELQQSIQGAKAAGMHVGNFLGAYTMAAPEQLQSIYQQTGQVAPAAAMMFGAGEAALNSILPAHLTQSLNPAAKIGLVGSILEKSGMEPGLVRNVASQMLTDAGINAAAGAGSAALSSIATNVVANNPQIFQSKDWQNVMHGAINGAIAGGVFGALGGAFKRSPPATEVKDINQTQSGNQATDNGMIEAAGQKALDNTNAVPAGASQPDLWALVGAVKRSPRATSVEEFERLKDINQTQSGNQATDNGMIKAAGQDVVESQNRLKQAMNDLFPEEQQAAPEQPVAQPETQAAAPEQGSPLDTAPTTQKTNDLLDQAGVSPNAPIRKRVGDLEVTTENADAIKAELSKYAKNPKVAKDVKDNINSILANHDVLKPQEEAAPKQGSPLDTAPKQGSLFPETEPETQAAAPEQGSPLDTAPTTQKTNDLLDQAGVSPNAPIRKRVGDLEVTTENADAIKAELSKYAKNPKVAKDVKDNINSILANHDVLKPQDEAVPAQETSVAEQAQSTADETQAVTPETPPMEAKAEPVDKGTPESSWEDMKDENAPAYKDLLPELKDLWDGYHDANMASIANADTIYNRIKKNERIEAENKKAKDNAPKAEEEVTAKYRGLDADSVYRRFKEEYEQSKEKRIEAENKKAKDNAPKAEEEVTAKYRGLDAVSVYRRLKEEHEQSKEKGNISYDAISGDHEANRTAEALSRNPSLSRKVASAFKAFMKGKITGEEAMAAIGHAYRYIKKVNQSKRFKASRVRGQDIIISKIRDAVRRDELPRGAAEFTEWLIKQNPHIVDDLGISTVASKDNTPAGRYNPYLRLMRLFKDAADETTPVHEIMHHAERMMPPELQQEIGQTWLKDLMRAAKKAAETGSEQEKAFYDNLTDYYLRDGKPSSYKAALDILHKNPELIKTLYQHVNPSEFWAVNATRILENRYNTGDSTIGKIKAWLNKFYQKAKEFIGLKSDAPVMRALDSLIKGDGKFRSESMLADGLVKTTFDEPAVNQTLDDFRLTEPSNIAKLPPTLQAPVRAITKTLFSNIQEKGLGTMLTEDIAELAKKYIPSVVNYVKAGQIKREMIRALEDNINHIVPRFQKLSADNKRALNQVLARSTYEGKWAYDPGIKGAKVDSEMAQLYSKLPPEAQQIVQDVFNHGATMLKEKQNAIRAHIDDLFADRMQNASLHELADLQRQKDATLKQFKAVLDLSDNLPYAPLKRFGNYIVIAKSKEYYEAEKNLDRAEINRLRSNENHYVVEFADTAAAAHAIRDELAQKGIYQIEEPFKRSEAKDKLYGGSELHAAFSKARRLLSANRADETLDPAKKAMYDQLDEMLHEMYLTSLADSSARKSEITRERIAGYNQDMMRSFFTQGMADARYVANLKYNKNILDALSDMQTDALKNRAKANPYLNEFLLREAQSLQVRTPSFLDSVNRMVGDWYLTFSPSFYLQQALQTYTFSLPRMAARFGYFKSSGALMQGYREVIQLLNKTGINDNIDLKNLPASVTAGERSMLDNLVKSGLIDIGIETTMHGARTDQGIFAPYTKVTNNLRSAVNKIEVLNRATAALASYRLALEKNSGKDLAAQQEAYDTVRTTHGSYDGFNTPRLFNTGPIARSVTQFRRFQIIQLTMLAKQLHSAFKGATPQERAIGRKETMFLLGHAMVLGGAKGLPYWAVGSVAYSILNSIFGDDTTATKDFEAYLRDKLGSSATLLLKGAPAALGVDMSSKLGMGTVLSIAPYTNVDLTSATGYEKTAMVFAGPFAGGMLPNMADGVGLMAQGDYYKGLEKFMPNIVANSMKGYRFVNDGVTNKQGDMIMSPQDITFVDGLMQSLGLPPTKFTERSYRAEEVYKTNQYFQNTEKNIIHQYSQAASKNDTDGMDNARNQFMQLQNERAANGYTRQSLGTMLKSVQTQHKRERQIIGGVEANKQNRAFVQSLADQ